MKKNLHLAVTVLCVLMLLLTTASCMVAQLPHTQQATCGECPAHTPLSQTTPACCATHQQPSSATITIEVEQPAHSSQIVTPLFLNTFAQSIALSATSLSETPPLPQLIALRI